MVVNSFRKRKKRILPGGGKVAKYSKFSAVRRALYAGLVLAIVVALAPTAYAVKPDEVRDFEECIHTCNGIKDACDNDCQIDCAAAFPGDQPAIDACVSACEDACQRFMRNCKAGCKFEKTGKTPNVP